MRVTRYGLRVTPLRDWCNGHKGQTDMGMKAFFASEMRRVREEKNMSIKELAEITRYKEASLRVFENAHRTPTVALAVGLDKAFGTPGTFVAMQSEAEQDSSSFGELKESEQRATAIRIWDMRIPGLLQVKRYASAMLANLEDVEERIERQGIFNREDPPHVHIIIGEDALYAEVGGTSVLREQLEHLIRPDAPWILQVMPDMAGAHTGMDGPLTLLEFEGDEPAIAYLDSRHGGTVADDADQVSGYWRDWERLTAEAMPPSLSHDMIWAVIQDLPEG